MPATPAICALADVKAWLGIANSTADTLLTGLITATQADFLAEIQRRDFWAADWTETRRGAMLERPFSRRLYQSAAEIVLRHWPINSIVTVTLDGTDLPASSDGLADGYWVQPEDDPEQQRVLRLLGYIFTSVSELSVAYNAGYSSAPADVSQAVIEWVAARYRMRTGAGMQQYRVGEAQGQVEEAVYQPWDIPKSTQRVIDRYVGAGLGWSWAEYA